MLAACSQLAAPARSAAPRPTNALPVTIAAAPLAAPSGCSDTFVAHDLDHTTTTPGDTARMFDGNGSGVAIGDLDDDGRLDVVLANSHGPNTILWNIGGLRFRAERMPQGDSRAVNLVDVDGDGRLDMVFTRRMGGLSFWRNLTLSTARRTPQFEREQLPGVALPAYSMAWGDLNGDGALDLVAGSYDAELLSGHGSGFLMGSGAGVYVYERAGAGYRATQLARKAQALAIALFDVDGDGRRDILAGNDFAVRDGAWARKGNGWIEAHPFARTSQSTMSFDSADVDNDGAPELFATDMKPYDTSVATLATWQPMMVEMFSPLPLGDPQIVENTLQVRDGASFRNQGYARGVAATGWSWSGVFGDLDDDGAQDLYVVNGMIEAELFNYLARGELVERNQALRNDGAGNFTPAPEWELGSERSGRGMAMADLDGDGDLDIVINNLRSPAQLFENRLCGGPALEVDLRWPSSQNTRALGATATLHTSAGSFTRDVRASAGYLSGPPSRLHFGIPEGARLEWLEIRWPDGAVSAIEGPAPRTLATATR
jgi:enediyne biosynthesis protein E4